ncbi:hypothetical protein GCM10010346_34660 [Streptomyces chryseus]|uniref:Uncharacterized protein n=1 Tax=Streptomyces chryseus TaxID=68186 RepID=A0ABQ3DMY8_9ACTN|nr:hypothetical protein GCM10010346_34660 [Streptomyces chryseus]
MAEDQGAEQVADRDHREVVRRRADRHVEELGQDDGVTEGDRVVEERLADEERQAERRGRRRREMDRQRDHEQLLAAVEVGEPAEKERTHACSGDIQGSSPRGHLSGGDVDAAAFFGEAAHDVADDGHFETVEDPHRAQADDDPPVPR